MRELLMIRHGATESNEQKVFGGGQDVPLSDKGRAALAAQREGYPPGDFFFTSGMLRTLQTLDILYGDVPHVDIPDLREYRFGDFEGRSHEDLVATEPLYRKWLDVYSKDIACPGGETRNEFEKRVSAGWHTLLSHAWSGLGVLVAHGGVLVTLLGKYAQAGEAHYHVPQNGQGWLVRLGETGEITHVKAFP